MNETKGYLLGSVFILSGTLLLGLMHLAIALYLPHLTSWSSPPGKFVTMMNDMMGWFPYLLGLILLVAGVVLVCRNYFLHKPTN
ncbi:hypothetical protein BpOF4_17560 [Alkalihalophilus pseudofirmus OF4]|uniref:Uncharacterized protein n=1 Tax=Alkalihalophilus pseudofirmus (strain ATCC BAA-2126 / JCM 17055 / OF4) TaxID=398511 RepID=D3FRG2_ALKPO|nr:MULTISPECIES: hypothetical protein [Alkalihalophilus]ADC51553.1 hypothetical protein BpOF4_17560 [Alkalihalophilus pseudofirmus OF4]MED1603342.1 hypothetical protein [Alkalihalophilus marmarensis]